MNEDRPRILIFAGKFTRDQTVANLLSDHYDVDVFESMEDAMRALREQPYHAVFADVGDFLPLERELVGEKSSLILNTIGEGVCICDAQGNFSWSNKRMRGFAGSVADHVRRICAQAMAIFQSQSGPYSERLTPRSKKFTFQVDSHYYEMICSPVTGEADQVEQVVAVVWDATSGKRLQSKIDAIDASGRELARIDAEAVTKLAPSNRLKLLQDKIIRYSKDLMHFDHFAIRLLNKRSNQLEVVIAEGLPPEALEIDLYAQPEGNGISGYVASSGRSYICHDTEKDPRYVLGLEHSKSSLTVPLMLYDEVIGVYNIESEQVGAFNEDDRQFAEIFGRYVAMALNILDLLVVERYTTSGQITDNVVQEMDSPLADIVNEAESLREQHGEEDGVGQRLDRIVTDVESIRDAIRDVAAGPTTVIGSSSHEADEHDPLLADKRILIADDEDNIRRTMHDVLKKHGCDIEMAKDGYEACALLDQQPFDLVISDIKMPYRNGYEIFAAAQRAHAGVPVMLMTGFGYDPHHSIVRASQEGLSTVLFKPFKVDEFLEEVHKAVSPETTSDAEESSPEAGGEAADHAEASKPHAAVQV